MNASIRDTSIRLNRPNRPRRRLRRLANTSYRTAMREGISRASDIALYRLDEALPDSDLMVFQMTSRRAWA